MQLDCRTNYRLLDMKWPKFIFFSNSSPRFVGSKTTMVISFIMIDWMENVFRPHKTSYMQQATDCFAIFKVALPHSRTKNSKYNIAQAAASKQHAFIKKQNLFNY